MTPKAEPVPVKLAKPTRNTVVVDATDMRAEGTGNTVPLETVGPTIATRPVAVVGVGIVADVVLMPACVLPEVADNTKPTVPVTSQSPAVSEIEVTLAVVFVVSATADPAATVLLTNSPTLPALALLFVVVPTMPAVWLGVIVEVADKVVNAPAAGVVPPIAGGDARYVEKPVPLTVLLAARVVNAPAPGVVDPIDGGDAK